MLAFFLEYGLWGLFFAAFLAATVLPLSSELVVFGLLYSEVYSRLDILFVATLGNFLGGSTNYYLGKLAPLEWLERWFKISQERLHNFQKRFQKSGSLAALLCWVPIIGDPLAIALGWFKVPVIPVLIYMFIGKFLRYLVLTLPFIS